MTTYTVRYQSPESSLVQEWAGINATSPRDARDVIWRKLFRAGEVSPTGMELISGSFEVWETA